MSPIVGPEYIGDERRRRSDHLIRTIRNWLVTLTLASFIGLSYTVWKSYQGRVDLVVAQQAACERAKLDRKASAALGVAILGAFHQTDKRFGGKLTPERAAAEAGIEAEVAGLSERASIVCDEAFPSATLLP